MDPAIAQILETVVKNEGFDNYTVTKITRNAKGEGYLGEVFMVTVKDTKSDKEMDLVIKAAFKDEAIRNVVPIRLCFENEVYFYSVISLKYRKLIKDAGIEGDFKLHPKCLAVSLNDKSEVLVLENLQKSGFEMFDKYQVLDDEHAKFIFKTYGKFHALSFALKDKKNGEYEELVKNIHNVYDFVAPSMTPLLLKCDEMIRDSLIPGRDDEIIKAYEKYHGENITEIFKAAFEKKSKYSAILHGDCWSNNMMFKYQTKVSKKSLNDICLLDFQLMREGSPVCDLSYFFYSGGSKPVFNNLDTYLKIYHDSFSSFLKSLGCQPEQSFPFEALKEEWRTHCQFGFIMSFVLIKMKMTKKEDIVDLTDLTEDSNVRELFTNAKVDMESFGSRIRDLLEHLQEIKAL